MYVKKNVQFSDCHVLQNYSWTELIVFFKVASVSRKSVSAVAIHHVEVYNPFHSRNSPEGERM